LAASSHRHSFRSIHCHKRLLKKTLRSCGQVSWKRSLCRRCFNLALANSSNFHFCAVCLCCILLGLYRKPDNQLNKKTGQNNPKLIYCLLITSLKFGASFVGKLMLQSNGLAKPYSCFSGNCSGSWSFRGQIGC
jgi:hypothetical protein